MAGWTSNFLTAGAAKAIAVEEVWGEYVAVARQNRPLALRGHVTNVSFKQ